jgi:hypothetical protein
MRRRLLTMLRRQDPFYTQSAALQEKSHFCDMG